MQLKNSTIAVTGATGFLGHYIVEALLQRGARVVGVVRNPGKAPELAARGVALRRADLSDRDALARGFEGAGAVVSNAAHYAVTRLLSFRRRNREEHLRVNGEGTRNLMEAAAAAGAKRIVHVSSVSVYRGGGGSIDESHPQLTAETRPTPANAYSVSKAVSEQLAWRLAAELGLELTAIRPSGIYGAFDPNFTAILKRLLGLPVTVYPAFTRLGFVYAGDVAEAIVLALERPESIGRAYNVTGDDNTLWDLARAWRTAGGGTAWLMLPVPVPIRRRFDHGRARRDLGWRNRPLVEGMRDTLEREARGR